MSQIDEILMNDASQWVLRNIQTLPEEAKYRAFNAIRALEWANRINATAKATTNTDACLEIPACYCSLHAIEEAVATFISCAKKCGYGPDANISIKSHSQKSAITILAQKLQSLTLNYKPAIAYSEQHDTLALRLTIQDEVKRSKLSLSEFPFDENDTLYSKITQAFGDEDDLLDQIIRSETARLTIFYADDKGYPTGFTDPDKELLRGAQITIGLIWASIDIHLHYPQKFKLVENFLRAAKTAIKAYEKRKTK